MRRVLLLLLAALSLGLAPAGRASGEEVPLLVSADWLAARLGQPGIRIVDLSTYRVRYQWGHIPGAVYLDVGDANLVLTAGAAPAPVPEAGARLLGRLGITPDTLVVAYDDEGGLHAARLFLTLEAYGHRRVALLDGGSQAWRRGGHPWTTSVPVLAAATYTPTPAPGIVVGAEWVRDRLAQPAVVVVDARTPEEFAGTDVRARRGGHIPGAVNIDWRRHLRADGTFRPPAELRAMYVERGVTPDKMVVTYCQTHHRAAHTYFVLRLLGYPRVTGYDRSWAEWGNRPDLPVARP